MVPSTIRQPMPVRTADTPRPMLAELAPPEPAWVSAPPPSEPSGGAGRLIGYLKYHWVLILFLGSLLSAGLAFAAWSLIPSKYTTYALLQVSLRPEEVAFQTEKDYSRTDFAIYLKTQADLIKSQYVLVAALRDPEVANLPMLKKEADPIRFLEEQIEVMHQDGSEIIRVSLTGDDPSQITKIVNAVQGAYYEEIIVAEQNAKRTRLSALKDSREKMEDELEERVGSLPEDTGEGTAFDENGEIRRTNQIATSQLLKLEDQQLKTELDIASLKRIVGELQSQLKSADDIEVTQLEIDAVLKADGEFQEALKRLPAESKAIQRQADYVLRVAGARGAAEAAELRAEAEAKLAEIDTMRQERIDTLKQTKLIGFRGTIEKELGLARQQLAGAEERLKVTLAQISVQREKLKPEPIRTVDGVPLNPDMLQTEIEQRYATLQEVIQQIQIKELEVSAPARVRKLQEAAVPMQKEFKKQLLGTGFAGLMGFVLVGLGVVAFESRVKRVMAFSDVKQIASGPVFGVVPSGAGAEVDASAPAWANGRMLNEAIDKIRTLTMLRAEPGKPFTLMVTSANTDEGRSMLAWKLTLSLAKAGYRTLLIDADMRTPSLHLNMGVPNEQGLCEVLRGSADLRASIQPVNDGMSFLPAGKWDDQVRQDLAGDKVATLFDRLREPFDCIVVHAHAILSVTDTFLIGRHTDATLLAVQRNQSRMPLLGRAQDRVQALNQPAGFGVVYLGATEEEALI